MILDEHQKKVVAWRQGTAVVAAAAGCHRIGQPLLMHSGAVELAEKVAVGDLLMGPDSAPRRILQLIRGRGEMVEIRPVKGDPFVVNLDHVLTIVRSGKRWVERGHPTIVDVSVRAFLEWSPYHRSAAKLLRTGVTYVPGEALPVDPYFLGVLLGDGSMAVGDSIVVHKLGLEIETLCRAEALRWGLSVNDVAGEGKCPSWRFSAGQEGGVDRNPLINALRSLNLRCTGDTKFIPALYLTASFQARRALLAGLIDSDGLISNNCCDFISKSRRLSEDFTRLARSVGLAAYMVSVEKHDQNGHGGTYWRVSVSGDLSALPMRIKPSGARRQIKDVLRTGFEVVRLNHEEDFYGFILDGDGRYLLGDFTITHNSGKTTVAIERVASLIEDGVMPESIITLVFNHDAAETLVKRLKVRLGVPLAKRCHAYTFHGYCLRTMNEWFPGAPMLHHIIGTDGGPRGSKVALAAMRKAGLKGEWKVYLMAADQIRDALIDIAKPGALAKVQALPVCGGDLSLAQQYIQFGGAYQHVKQAQGCIDYADMLYTVCYHIKEALPPASTMQVYTHIQCDESQDVNPARLMVLRHLAEHAQSLVIVGDLRQSIYAFAGARPDLFQGLLDGATLLTLPVNRRSTKAIVDVGNAISAGRSWNLGGACSHAEENGEGEPVQIWAHTRSSIEQAEEIAEAITAEARTVESGIEFLKLADENKRPRFACLTRTNAEAAVLEATLVHHDIPVRVRGQKGGVWESQPAKDVLMYLRTAQGLVSDDLSMIANKPKRYLKREVVDRVVQRCKTAGAGASLLIEALDHEGGAAALFASDLRRVTKLLANDWESGCKAISRILAQTPEDLTERVAEAPDDDKAALYAALCSTAGHLGSVKAIEDEIEACKRVKGTPAVEISTVHKMKGDEAEHVFVCGVNSLLMPHENADDIEEERRIFYVACTRAKKRLTISVGGSAPSQFLRESKLITSAHEADGDKFDHVPDPDPSNGEEHQELFGEGGRSHTQRAPTAFVRKKGKKAQALNGVEKVVYTCGIVSRGVECTSKGVVEVPFAAWEAGTATTQCRGCLQKLDQSHLKKRE